MLRSYSFASRAGRKCRADDSTELAGHHAGHRNPEILATLAFAWWFRATNKRARYLPEWAYSGRIELIVWSIPALVVFFLGGIAWIGSHDLDPARPLSSSTKPLEVDVVSLDWKWLFIYPDQGVASVNRLVAPVGVPLHLRITSATVLNVFFVPRLGSEIYAMNGMASQLNLQADEPGVFPGLAAHFSGDGFSDMNFEMHALPVADFTAWTTATRASGPELDEAVLPDLATTNRECETLHLQRGPGRLVRCHPAAKATARRRAAHRTPRCLCLTGQGEIDVFGKLTWQAIPFDQPIPLVTSAILIVVLTGLLLWVAVKGYIPYLWKEWITSVDHKRIGIMYCLLALVMLLRGFSRRTDDALATGVGFQRSGLSAAGALRPDLLGPRHHHDFLRGHAVRGRADEFRGAAAARRARRRVSNAEFRQLLADRRRALLVNLSLVVGEFAAPAGCLSPLSELTYSPGVGVDYYAWSLEISGIGTLMAGINMVTTILKMRAPGMSYTRMPVFCWTSLASNLLIVAAFPILTATLAMLLLDRYVGFHFFTNEAGGNPMMFMNLIWAWGHPEVYILVLPAFGVFSEVISTFSGKPLFGYRSMVIATMAICLLSFLVWLHHFFTMGPGGDVNGFFGIMSMIIAIPTGVKLFNWLFTMYGGRVRFTVPDDVGHRLHGDFALGGMTGVLLAVPPADFVLHNSLFLVAHFHNVIIGGVLFGAFAGYTYWFPKAFGFSLDERLGKAAFWCWFVGFYVAFMPLYVLGLLGMTRRMQHYTQPEWYPWVLVAGLGALIILTGIVLQVTQLTVSIRTRARRRELTGDPWDGRTLEWATASPPPAYNFAVLPNVERAEPYWGMKLRRARICNCRRSRSTQPSRCHAIARPASSLRSLRS